MIHHMNLHKQPFSMIKSGKKTIELRLLDEKRKKIAIGDTLIFTSADDTAKTLTCRVKDLHIFSDFDALYQSLPLVQCGYLPCELASATPKDMKQYYPPEKQKEYGVVGIEFEIIPHSTLLITGFDPFGGADINPSWEAVKCLPDQIGDWQLTKLEIPTVFGLAAQTVLNVARELQPDAIICVGQAGGRNAVTPELFGVNLRNARIADNVGNQPLAQPIEQGAPATYASTLPVCDMVHAVRRRGLPCCQSFSAGRFVCNDVLYTLLHYYRDTPTKVGFIHVPYMPEQAKEGQPSMTLGDIVKALETMIDAM